MAVLRGGQGADYDAVKAPVPAAAQPASGPAMMRSTVQKSPAPENPIQQTTQPVDGWLRACEIIIRRDPAVLILCQAAGVEPAALCLTLKG